jgi:hypothetical protein
MASTFESSWRFRSAAVLGLVLWSGGCGDDLGKRLQASATVSEHIATVVTVRWTTAEPTVGYVQYGKTRDMEMKTPLEPMPTTDHEMLLLGMVSDTEYFFRVITWDGAAAGASGIQTVTTGPLPIGLPSLKRTGSGNPDYNIVPILGMKTAVTILNPDGEIVWYHTEDRALQFYRARLALDGKSVLYNAAQISGAPSPDSELVRVSLDGSTTSSIKVPYLAHDFLEHPDGTLAAIAVEFREFEGTQLRGDKIVEIAPDGTQRTVWSAWDCFNPAVAKSDNSLQGWTFANALDFDPVANVYYIGMRNFSSIARINRTSGACEWVLGTTAPTFTFAPGSARFLHQHQFQVYRNPTQGRGDRIMIMDNDGSPGDESRVLEYELDTTTNVATQTWRYVSNPTVYTFVLGEPIRYPDGSVFINWSAAGQMERLDKDGTSTWKLNTGAGSIFGFNTVANSLYPANAQMP